MTKYQDTTQSCKKQSHLLNHTICKALKIMCFKSNKQKNTAIAITPGRIDRLKIIMLLMTMVMRRTMTMVRQVWFVGKERLGGAISYCCFLCSRSRS